MSMGLVDAVPDKLRNVFASKPKAASRRFVAVGDNGVVGCVGAAFVGVVTVAVVGVVGAVVVVAAAVAFLDRSN